MKISKDKFYGVLVGGVIGDCLGAPFEGVTRLNGIKHERIFKKISSLQKTMKFTDDTAMSLSVCKSLTQNKKLNIVHMASCFAKEYKKEPFRGYGGGVVEIFGKWNESDINEKNVFQPSNEQFEGSGSYGNGAAMRASPIALFAKDTEEVIKTAMDISKLTHSNKYGYVGGILQALAVYIVLHSDKIKAIDFVNELQNIIGKIESLDDDNQDDTAESSDGEILDDIDKLYEYTRSKSFSFSKQLEVIIDLLALHDKNPDEDDQDLVIKKLGCDVSAQQAVPTALYCFLRNLDKDFESSLYYSISIGGDTDTIATMCCALAGAYFGYSNVPKKWIDYCEGVNDMKSYADKFYDLYLENI